MNRPYKVEEEEGQHLPVYFFASKDFGQGKPTVLLYSTDMTLLHCSLEPRDFDDNCIRSDFVKKN